MFERLKQRYHYSIILLRQLVITDFKLRYQGSVLGYLWTLLKPLALFAILYVVFVRFLRFGADEPHFAVSLLFGIVLWNYFTEVTLGGVASIVSKGDLMRKLYFPRYVIVVAGSLSALINLLLNLVVVAFFMVLDGVVIGWTAPFAIIPIIEIFITALSLSFLLSALYVKFRDVNYIWEVVLQAAFYATPIIYPLSMVIPVSTLAVQIMLLNPIAQALQDARALLIDPNTITIADAFGTSLARLIPISVVLCLTAMSIWYFRRESPNFAENV
ncbi:MAG: ABC transporter permease [Candidatus Saccharimonadales bacterium]